AKAVSVCSLKKTQLKLKRYLRAVYIYFVPIAVLYERPLSAAACWNGVAYVREVCREFLVAIVWVIVSINKVAQVFVEETAGNQTDVLEIIFQHQIEVGRVSCFQIRITGYNFKIAGHGANEWSQRIVIRAG